MGLTKSEIFTEEQNRIAALAKAIAHPARIAIIQHILKKNSCICGELVEEIGLSQSTISQHLRELKDIGMIKGSIDGPKVCYCINPEIFVETKSIFNKLLTNCCDSDCC